MGLFSSIGKVVGKVAGPILGLAGSVFGAEKSAKSVEASNAMSAQSVREQMAFQERMSNTGYQRAVKDMRKAGLNPMLAYSQGPSSTPSGSSFTAAPEWSGESVRAVSQAVPQMVQVVGNLASIDKTRADTEVSMAEAKRVDADTLLKLMQRQTESYRSGEVTARTGLYSAQEHLSQAQRRQVNEMLQPMIDKVLAEASASHATAQDVRQRNFLMKKAIEDGGIAPYIYDWLRNSPVRVGSKR